MKALSETIRAAQRVQNEFAPALKVTLQDYTFPAVETHLRYNAFDWTKVWEGNKPIGAKAVCASDGSLIFADSPVIFSGEVAQAMTVNENFIAEPTINSKTVRGFLNDGTAYSWWVCPYINVNWDVTNIYATWTFTNTTTTSGTTARCPDNTSQMAGTEITFKWLPTAGASKYWLYIYETAASPRITRFANPTEATDYTTRGAQDTPSFVPAPDMSPKEWVAQAYMPIVCTDFDLIAHPTTGEVMCFWTSNVDASDYNRILYKTSDDNGVNWNAATNTPWITPTPGGSGIPAELYAPRHIAAAYKPNGDVCLAATEGRIEWRAGLSYVYTGYDQYCYFKQRIGGTWDTSGAGPIGPFGQPTYGWWKMYTPYGDDFFTLHGVQPWPNGVSGGVTLCPTYTKSIDLEYDGDWILTMDFFQSNVGLGSPGMNGTRQAPHYGILGDGESFSVKESHWYSRINLTDAQSEIDSLQDLSHFSSTMDFREFTRLDETLKKRLSGWSGTGKALLREDEHIDITEGQPYSFLYKITDFPLIMTVCDGDAVHFLKKREDTDIAEGVFTNASKLNNPFPLGICANSSHAFAYNSNQLFISPLPTYWSVPTIGAGAGASTDIAFDAIVKVHEDATNPEGTKTLDVYFNDYNNDFSSAGAFQTRLDRGNRVGLYLGYYVGSTEYMVENARYFVDSWEATRKENFYMYALHCVDAWGLLNNYIFMRPVRFNIFSDDYNVLELIEMTVNTIGGSLSEMLSIQGDNQDMIKIYPKVEVNAGDNAGNLLRRLLKLIPQKIKFFGNDGTMVTPSYLDAPTYCYKFPS